MATDRDELTSYEYRQLRARILAASDVCIVCGHGASDTADHIHPVSKGGARLDPDILAPIHGVKGCPVCLHKCRYGLECPPLWGTPRNPDRPSLGPKLWKVMTRLGAPPMPWQKYVSDVALEIDPVTGLFAHREVGVSVPRQQGKTELCLAAQVHRSLAWQRQTTVYAAQTRGMARQRWEDEFREKISGSDLARMARIRKSNGNEAILWGRTRSKMGITANTEKAAHGLTLDLGFIDEAFAHEDDRLEGAFSPAMLTRPMAQLWWASAGGTTKSVWLNKKRETGRALVEALYDALAEDAAAVRPRVAYLSAGRTHTAASIGPAAKCSRS
ncbi:hypothetical protein WBG99_18865 [Streptomyces sp. TG1A-60]|uniref:hypothetical protein n=1 Tax=Streptomyces sp. TG1A-60 TaxID=3129111 RepID=UPI0030CDA2E4